MMPSYICKPGHPLADEHGMVLKEDYYMHKYMTEPDLRMMNGNEPVTIRFISDEMPATRHMVDGKYYTSKKKFRNETKARGCVEVGDQTHYLTKPRKPILPDKKQRVEDIKKAIYQLQNK